MAFRKIINSHNPSAPYSEIHCTHSFAWCEHSRNNATLMDELKFHENETRQFSYTKNVYSKDTQGTPILGRQNLSVPENYYCHMEVSGTVHPPSYTPFRNSSEHRMGNEKTVTPSGSPTDMYNNLNCLDPGKEFIPSFNHTIPSRWNDSYSKRDLMGFTMANNVPLTQMNTFVLPQYMRGQSMNNECFGSMNQYEYRTSELSMSRSCEPRGYKVIEGSEKSMELRDAWRPIQQISLPLRPCSFCRSNGESSSVYGSHTLRNQRGAVVCPILSKHKCELCQATGENAHTLTYCPILVNANRGKHMVSTTVALKASRVKSNGQRRNM